MCAGGPAAGSVGAVVGKALGPALGGAQPAGPATTPGILAPATPVDPRVIAARQSNQANTALGAGFGASILTSTAGLTNANNTAQKTLLGQ